MDVIKVTNLSKNYGDFCALRKVDLTIHHGEFFGCFGPNAAGKTTFLKILTGQLEQTTGTAEVWGFEVHDDPLKVKSMIGIVPEFESPPSFLTSEEYLYFVCKVRNVENPEPKIKHWTKFFELDGHSNKICKDLSKGMRQKVMLAAAFISEPKLLFLDEPFINLDPIFQKKVKEYLKMILKKKVTIFMCTHLLEIAEKLCHRVAILNKGRIIACDSIDNLKVKASEDLGQIFFRLVKEDKKK
jgi:ABC-2 type transport system ATP-binding protein